MTLFCYL